VSRQALACDVQYRLSLLKAQPFTDNGLIDYLLFNTSPSRIFHLCGDVTIAVEGLPNLGLCSALRAFEQGWIFIVLHLL
jgi:hypothetical protein